MDNSTVTTTFHPRDKNSTLTLVLIGVIIIMCLGFIVVVIGYVGLTTGTNTPVNTTNQISNSTNETDTPLIATDPRITITAPQLESIVNGEIIVKGSATYHFSTLKVEIFDNEDNRIGSSSVSISSVSDAPNSWETSLDVTKSPSTSTGKIVVSSIEPALTETLTVKFEVYSNTPANLILYAPLENQTLISSNLNIRGEVKGLFEGNLQIRLKDSLGALIYSGVTTIADQYEAFKPFNIDITIDSLEAVSGNTGVLEFYYQNAKDGDDVILQSIDVRFM